MECKMLDEQYNEAVNILIDKLDKIIAEGDKSIDAYFKELQKFGDISYRVNNNIEFLSGAIDERIYTNRGTVYTTIDTSNGIVICADNTHHRMVHYQHYLPEKIWNVLHEHAERLYCKLV